MKKELRSNKVENVFKKIEIKKFSYFSHDTDRLRLVGKKFPKILIANPEDGRKSPRAVSGICLSRPPLRRIDVPWVAALPLRPAGNQGLPPPPRPNIITNFWV